MPQRRSRQASSGGQRRTRSPTHQAELHQRGTRSSTRQAELHQRGTRSSTRQAELHQRGTRSPTRQAELLFSVSQVERMLWERHFIQYRSPRTQVFITAIIQDLTAKVLELAGNEAQKHGSSSITPEVMDMVFHSNPLFSSLYRETVFSQVAPAEQ
ncbi:Histone H2A-Bbd type 2/3 [Manis javanica]|nr:Histone H2A-Bbd type 2/3 [Manis javanica]